MLNQRRSGGVIHLTLDRPERGNALGPELVEALIEAVGNATAEAGVHTLVLRGAGRHFCHRAWICRSLPALSDGDLLWRLVRIETLLAMVWHAPVRTVVLAQGRTWGAGADLLLACELRVAAQGTTFRFPGAQFGIVLGTRRLAERIGTDAARTLVLGGGEFDAAQACSAGLVQQVADELPLADPLVDAPTARAIRAATRPDLRDADMAALVRSAAAPGLKARITAVPRAPTAAAAAPDCAQSLKRTSLSAGLAALGHQLGPAGLRFRVDQGFFQRDVSLQKFGEDLDIVLELHRIRPAVASRDGPHARRQFDPVFLDPAVVLLQRAHGLASSALPLLSKAGNTPCSSSIWCWRDVPEKNASMVAACCRALSSMPLSSIWRARADNAAKCFAMSRWQASRASKWSESESVGMVFPCNGPDDYQ